MPPPCPAVAILALDFAFPMKTGTSNDPSRTISSIVADEETLGVSFGESLGLLRKAVRLLRPPEGPKREWENKAELNPWAGWVALWDRESGKLQQPQKPRFQWAAYFVGRHTSAWSALANESPGGASQEH
ncbi:hypothetical protein L207DRAFT_588415 [Hyaloscypha variabilis F]|uniref:Uncharacterized protein n=1 Tax=Hyaloscypha variabilis (strain UAMH 11265 / GT02V1 / F) TaxID=1149755 RepID=A0A2J6R8S2_HYAVF|nr:hypothetical protein L207DRAFT_588415 [Hyaloscypha variabilis F]